MRACPFCNTEIPEGRRRCRVCKPEGRGRAAKKLSRQVRLGQQFTQAAIVGAVILVTLLLMYAVAKKT